MASTAAAGRIVVVDDDDLIRVMLTALLQEAGHEVVGEASNGLAGIRLAVALRPDLVTMDLEMPVLDGIAATRSIVAARIAPVVVVSGSNRDDDRAAAFAVGARWFVQKVDAPAELPRAVNGALEIETAARASPRRFDPVPAHLGFRVPGRRG
jgi:DNA-binding NarL/FixJ family response regulator